MRVYLLTERQCPYKVLFPQWVLITFVDGMKKKKVKRLRITEQDFLLANRKAAREEEILAHGKPISFRTHLHKSKKQYDRKRLKRAIKSLEDGSAKGM